MALVLPKRATVFQILVDEAAQAVADGSKKRVVLITSENGLLPLAGSVGSYVAKNPQSKPEVPDGPGSHEELPDVIDEPVSVDDDVPKQGQVTR